MLRKSIFISHFPFLDSILLIHSHDRTPVSSLLSGKKNKTKNISVFHRICVPGGFMLATVLGCVCLGIASIIYLVVSFGLYAIFFVKAA